MNIRDMVESVRELKAVAHTMPPPDVLSSLSKVLLAFMSEDANRRLPTLRQSSDPYRRLLLTSVHDDFQIVVALWAPGSASPIHDHDGTVGAVSALVGETEETKYEVLSSRGGVTDLRRGNRLVLRPAIITSISPDDATQLHEMRNITRREWSATIHIYVDAIHRYGVYRQQPNGSYRRELRGLWFDRDNASALIGATTPGSPR